MSDLSLNIERLKRLRKHSALILIVAVSFTILSFGLLQFLLHSHLSDEFSVENLRRANSILIAVFGLFMIIWTILVIYFFDQTKATVMAILNLNKAMQAEMQERTEELNFTGQQLFELTNKLDLLVQERTDELQESNLKLKSSNEELERFAQVASHDMKEPLRMISSYLQLLQRKYNNMLDEEGKEFIHFAVDGSNRLQEMISDLLEYARLDKTTQPEFELVELDQIFTEVRKNLEVAIRESKARITIPENLPTVLGDKGLLTRLFQNLVSNAIKFRDQKDPVITVGLVNERPDFHSILIEDNGIGIAKEDLKKIFQVFRRLKTKKTYEGNGIGLAVCKKIVDLHKGKIEVDSAPGKGTTFHIHLPVDLVSDQELNNMLSNSL